MVLTGSKLQSNVSAPEAASGRGSNWYFWRRPMPEVAHDAQILIATCDSHLPAGLPFFKRDPVPKAQIYLACFLALY